MLNVTFTGNIFKADGTPATNIRYQGFFIKTNPNSSNTIWDTPRLSEDNQYNFNLGDNTWLSQQSGYASPNDKVVLCFWIDSSSDRTDTNLVEWCFIEWILDDRDVYVQNIQLRGAIEPHCSFDIIVGNVGYPTTIENINSNDDHAWMFQGKEHYQADEWSGYPIFDMNVLPPSGMVVDWGDGIIDTVSVGNYTHIYTSHGDYTVSVSLENHSGLQCIQTFDIRVEYQVINGLEWDMPSSLGDMETYTPSISGDLSRISGVDYYIDGALLYPNLAYNDTFDHKFTTPGNHTIKQCIKYNNGFENTIQCMDFVVEMDTVAQFVSSDYDCGLVFTDTSTIGNEPAVKYQWDVTHGMFVLAHVEGPVYSDWYYAWPYKGTFQVRLAVTDSNGRISSITKEYVVDQCIGTELSGGGGGGSPWVYQETKYVKMNEPLPVVHIISVDDTSSDPEDKKEKILILEIIDNDK